MMDNVTVSCYRVHMTTRPGPRTPTSIAMNRRERVLAEAIGRLHGSASAGVGVRESLRFMENKIRMNDQGSELDQIMAQIESEHAERDA